MRKSRRLAFAALAALIVMAIAAGTAAARTRIEFSTTTLRATARSLVFGSESLNISCDVTLNATLLRLITKRLGEHVGGLTEGRTTNCRNSFGESGNRVIIQPGMRILYSSISGTLPERINGGVFLIDAGLLFDIQALGGAVTARCLYEGRVAARARENPIRSLTIDPATDPHQPKRLFGDERGNTACPAAITLSGLYAITPEITIRLLER